MTILIPVLTTTTLLLYGMAARGDEEEWEEQTLQPANHMRAMHGLQALREHWEGVSSGVGNAAPVAGRQERTWDEFRVNGSSAPDFSFSMLRLHERAAASSSEEGRIPQNTIDRILGDGHRFVVHEMPAPGARTDNMVISADMTLARMTISLDGSTAWSQWAPSASSPKPIDVMVVLFVSPRSGGRFGSRLMSFDQGLEVCQIREMTFTLLHGVPRIKEEPQMEGENDADRRPPPPIADPDTLSSTEVQALFFDITDSCSLAAGKYAMRRLRKETNIQRESAAGCEAYMDGVDGVIRVSQYAAVHGDRETPDVRAVAAGGDGTVFWLVDELYQKADPPIKAPVGAIPFGTGNDLSRQLNTRAEVATCQGAGSADSLSDSTSIVGLKGTMQALSMFALAAVSTFDVWNAVVKTFPGGELKGMEKGELKPLNRGCKSNVDGRCEELKMTLGNYGSVGFESLIGLKFEKWRGTQSNNNRWRNLLEYAKAGIDTALGSGGLSEDVPDMKAQPLKDFLQELHDGSLSLGEGDKDVPSWGCDPTKGGGSLVFMNVECIMGGSRKWPTDGISQPAYNDGLLEAISFANPLGMAVFDGLTVRSCAVGQYRKPQVLFQPNRTAPLQIDGEFFAAYNPKSFSIEYRESIQMLRLGSGHRGTIGSPTIEFGPAAPTERQRW